MRYQFLKVLHLRSKYDGSEIELQVWSSRDDDEIEGLQIYLVDNYYILSQKTVCDAEHNPIMRTMPITF